jgi:fatty-acyl-CoA synthase
MTREHNIADVQEAVARAAPDREAIVFRDRRISYARFAERWRRLANHLSGAGFGCVAPRAALAGWQSGQDLLALYLHNGNEYLEGMIGGFAARMAPFNVNYRYVEDELAYLLNDAGATAIIYHAAFRDRIAAVRRRTPSLSHLIQVDDGSGNPLLPGAIDYEAAIAGAADARPDVACSPDDLYVLYTGGTTGMPKGVLWRQADILINALGGDQMDSLEGFGDRATKLGGARVMAAAPFMHGAGHWAALASLNSGNTIVIQDEVTRLDPDDIWSCVARERVNLLQIVGDAFARPLIDQLSAKTYDLGSLRQLISGGAILNAEHKRALLRQLPQLAIADGVGSSEAGAQARSVTTRDNAEAPAHFALGPNAVVLSGDKREIVPPERHEIGWLAQRGRIPLGYLGDEAKSRATFFEVGGQRVSVPGDRARYLADGTIALLGRESMTINSGGEKIFAEEVEHAIKRHPEVYDAVVTASPSDRWGQAVAAVVSLRPGARIGAAEIIESCADHLARYKLPKIVVFRDVIARSPSGKADYRWAQQQVAARDPAEAGA